jgi:large subunit ribosomal protein L24
VQTTLLGLAIALILAIVAALVAPLVVDWNHYRAPLEAEASRLTGLNVRVNGTIDARLLPSPVITLSNVDVGEAGHTPQLRAGTLRLELALGPLLRGKVQPSEVHLIAPQLNLTIDRSGAVALPAPSPSSQPQALSISQFDVEDARVTLTDAASGAQLVLRKLYFNGQIASFPGPFNGQGATVFDDQLYGYRISGSPAPGGGFKFRLGIDPSNQPLTSDFDGTVTFAQGVPHFDGALTLTRPDGAALANGERVISAPWRATGTIQATPVSASIQNVAFRYGPEDRAINITGSAELTFGAHPRIAAKAAAMQLNVDQALAEPDVTDRPPLVVLKNFLQAFVAAAKLPVPAEVALSVNALTVGGTTIESLAGVLYFDRIGWGLDKFHFHAPGLTEVTVSGRLADTPQGFAFSGPATLASSDVETMLAWLDGRSSERVAAEAKSLNAAGDLTIASDRVALERLTASLGQEKIEGRLAYDWPTGNRPARLDAELRAGELDLDALSAFARSAAGAKSVVLPQEATLALDIGKATFAGVDARAVNAQVKFDVGKLQIDRVSIGDLAGAKLDISGRIDELSSQPRGQVTLDLNASALDGLSEMVAKLIPQQADALHRLAARLAPAKVHAVLNVERDAAASGSTAVLAVTGNLAAMRLVLNGKASGEPAHVGAATVQVDSRIDADDGSALVALIGLDRVLAVDQLPGQLTVSATGSLNGDIKIDAKIATSGFDSMLAGMVRLTGERAPAATLQWQAAAGDLRPLHQAMTGQPGDAVRVTAHAGVALDGSKLSITDLAATIGKSSLHGNLAVDWTSPIGVDGDIKAGDVDAASVVGLLLGLPANADSSAAPWSTAKVGGGAFTAMTGAVNFTFDRAALTPTLMATDLKGIARFGPSAILLDNIEGGFAGGHVAGALRFSRTPDGLAAHVALDLADTDAATIAGPLMNVTGGKLTWKIESEGFGASPLSLVNSLHGRAAVTLKDVQFAGLEAGAFAAAKAAAGQASPIDMGKVQSAVTAVLAGGHLVVPQGNAPITIVSGAMDLNHLTLQAQGGAQLAFNGAIDLGRAAVDARMTLSEAAPPSALIAMRPELSVNLKGPLSAPQRTLDLSALTTWLSLSAAELQTRQIEMIEAAQRAGTAGQDVHPPPPDVRVVSPGTGVESALPSDLLSAPPRIERLQPQPALPSTGGTQTETAPAVGAPIVIRPSVPPPVPRARPSTSTAGTAEQNGRRSAPQEAEPSLPRAD